MSSEKRKVHRHILLERLLPPDVPKACNSCSGFIEARHWLVAPDGDAICTACEACARQTIEEYRLSELKGWSLHPIHHTDASDRTSHARPPICAHTTCAQAFIDDGSNLCREVTKDRCPLCGVKYRNGTKRASCRNGHPRSINP